MNTTISLGIFICFFLIAVFAHPIKINDGKKGTISSRVLDVKLKQPLPYAYIIIKNANAETLIGGIRPYMVALA